MVTEEIYPDGDVIFVSKLHPDAEEYRFRCSLTFLRNASPVFTTMFSGRYVEGQGLSAEHPKEIHLEEDDPKPLRTMLKLLHLRTIGLPIVMKTKALAKLTVVVDKYDCLDAVNLTMRNWYLWHRDGCNSLSDCNQLAFIAYTLKMPVEFRRMTRALVCEHNEPFAEVMPADEIDTGLSFKALSKYLRTSF